ncbi:MAG: diaminopimelate epimerase [Bacteroidota bacterium]
MRIPFHKYQGTGNDFVMLDNRSEKWETRLTKAQIARLCDRRFGIGADGLIMLTPDLESDFRMIYYNADGGESTMCGNGARCLVAFAQKLGVIESSANFLAIDGPHEASIEADVVSLLMGKPEGKRDLLEAGFQWIDTGSPHLIIPAEGRWEQLDVAAEGAQWRHHPEFKAIGGTNVNFFRRVAPDTLEVRTFERGVEAETLSCGTGVTASAYVYAHQHQLLQVHVHTPGGPLEVKIEQEGKLEKVWLKGPATFVFSGEMLI